jgi:sigma-B regulation protein RsbU (phosphoserine phosphatase)
MGRRTFRVEIPAEPHYLKSVRAFVSSILQQHCPEQCDAVVLALDECGANVIRHRCPSLASGSIHIVLQLSEDRVRLEIPCFCKPEDVPTIQPRELGEVRPGGLGTHFVDELMDRVAFEPDPENPGRVNLVLEKRVSCRDGGGAP